MTSIESSEAKAGDALHAANGAGKKVEVPRRGYAYDAQGGRLPARRRTRSRDDSLRYNDRSESTRRLAGRLDKSAAFAPKGRGVDGARSSQLTGATLGEDNGNAIITQIAVI